MANPITAAREQTARALATRELACWDGEHSPSTAEYIAAHYCAMHAILEPCGPLAPLCAAYEAQLATVTRERDEARASLATINADLQRAAQALARVVAPHVATMLACGECHTPVSADGAEVPRG